MRKAVATFLCTPLAKLFRGYQTHACLVRVMNNMNSTGLDMHAGQPGQTETCRTSWACFTDILWTDECVYLWITVWLIQYVLVCTNPLWMLFTSWRQADCSVWRPQHKPEAWYLSFWSSGAFPCSVSPSVAGGQQCVCKTCCHVLLSCIFNSVLGPWNAFCQSLWTCHVQTQPAERVYSLLCFCTFSKTAIPWAC